MAKVAEGASAAEEGRGDELGSRIVPLVKLLSGNLLGTLAGGVFFLTASWILPLEEMGRYSVAISAQWICVGLVGSGLSVATLRLAADRLEDDDPAGASGVVVLASATALGLTVAGALLAWLIGRQFPEVGGATPVLVACWAGSRSIIDCIRSGLLAEHRFGRAASLMVATVFTGLTALALTLWLGELTFERLLVAHVAGLSSGVMAAVVLAGPLFRNGVRISRGWHRELLRYARWPSLAEGTRLLQLNIGPILLISVAGSAEAGLFGVARYPAYVFDAIAVTLYQYWLSSAVRNRSEDMGALLVSQIQLAVGVGTLIVLGAIVARPLLTLLGSPFAEAAPLFVLNALDFAILLLVRPAESTYHGLHRPWLEGVQRGVVLPVLLGVGWLLAPVYGAEGMVWAHISGGIAAIVAAAALLHRHLTSTTRTCVEPSR